jgi:4-hydroxybutyrate CoA-transferase
MVARVSAKEAIALIQPGHRVFVHGAAATPLTLLTELTAQALRLHDVELIHLHLEGPAPYAEASLVGHLRMTPMFVGANQRQAVREGRAEYLPIFLSETPQLFRSGRRPVDVALVHVSPPDAHGYVSLGTSVDCAKAAVQCASIVIAQVNPQMPRVFGDGVVHMNSFHAMVDVNDPLPTHTPAARSPAEEAIGRLVAGLVEDGATLQFGIGAIPDAVCAALGGHRALGLHTEMWADGALALIESGVIDNSRKVVHPGISLGTFLLGSRAVYEHAHDNASVLLREANFVNNPHIIAKNPKVTAVNSAVEVDLTGQVCADSVGVRVVSGVGGQMDFIRGAAMSEGGKPIIALASRTVRGEPRIVATLQKGAGVVTTRAHVHYVVTEYGVADLYGKTLRERAQVLLAIAHPDDREGLERAWHAEYATGD